ncbi:MAG: recombinase family protein [Roseobacter sp.]|uniref:recombinase family protein n=1 Tax=Tateyamaria sp. TaxID=1929288 RepID=UPI003281F2B9
MLQYITYRRVSTKGQKESGLGLEAQDRDIQLFLNNYSPEPYEVVREFVEQGSGSKQNEELQKAVQLAKDTGATLLVSKLDRLSRKVSFIATLMDDKKLSLRVASMPNADKFQLHIYAALAEQERTFISIRTKQALKEAKAKGVKLGGLRDKTIKRNEAIQGQADSFASHIYPTIKRFRDSGMTLKDCADELNRLGIETARGGKWYDTTVRNALSRCTVAPS